MAEKIVHRQDLKVPITFTCTMTERTALLRSAAATLFSGISFTIQNTQEDGRVVGQTHVTDQDDLDTFNTLLENLGINLVR